MLEKVKYKYEKDMDMNKTETICSQCFEDARKMYLGKYARKAGDLEF